MKLTTRLDLRLGKTDALGEKNGYCYIKIIVILNSNKCSRMSGLCQTSLLYFIVVPQNGVIVVVKL